MKIEYNYSTDVTIQYDDTFEQHVGHVDLDHAKDTILFMFGEYNFTKGVAYDAETGEILLTIEAEEDGGEEYELDDVDPDDWTDRYSDVY